MNRRLTTLIIAIATVASLIAIAHGVDSIARHGILGVNGTRVYYDAVNGARHLWNRDNRRHRVAYHIVSGFHRFVRALDEAGYNVHAETYTPFNRDILDRYDVFFVGEQTYHARFMTEEQRRVLLEWVRDGGSLFTVVEHTDAHYMAEVFDTLYPRFPVKVRRDSICDINQPGPQSVDWVDLRGSDSHPVSKGITEFRFYNGASLDTSHGILFSNASAWSDNHNPESRPVQNGNKRRDAEEISGPLVGAAAFSYGRGRVVVISDHNSMSNPTLYWGDHHRFVMNAMRWLAGERFNRDALFAVAGLLLLGVVGFTVRRRRDRVILNRWVIGATGALSVAAIAGMTLRHPSYADLFLHTGNGTDMTYMTKSSKGYFTLYGQLTREPHLRPWASNTLKAGHDALFLSAPMNPYSAEQLDVIDDYLKRGKTVVYMASIRSLESAAGRQLQERFDFRMRIGDAMKINGRRPFLVNGPRDLTQGVFRMYVYGGSRGVTVDSGLQKQVWLTWGNFHIKDRDWRNTRHHFDLLSSKEISGGRFAVLAPVELFTDSTLKNLYQDADVVRQQMAEFIIRVAKWTIDDDTILEEE